MSHKSILVDGKVVNIPSFQVEAGSSIEVREKAKGQLRIRSALELSEGRKSCDWISVDMTKLQGVFTRFPDRQDLPSEINENLIVELYSR